MEFLIDNDRDPLRLIVLVLCIFCVVGLTWRRFYPPREDWNDKTKDYWFALMLFAMAGVMATIESLKTNVDYTTRLALFGVAAAVCLNGLRRGRR